MTDSPAATPVIRGYQPSDQPGFEALVQSVHAEYGSGVCFYRLTL